MKPPPNAAHGIPEAPVAAHPFPTNDPCSRPSERAHSYHGSFPAPLHTLTSARPKRPCHDIGPHSRCAGVSDRGPTKSSTAALVLTAVLSPPPLTISGISSLLAPKSLLARFGPLNLLWEIVIKRLQKFHSVTKSRQISTIARRNFVAKTRRDSLWQPATVAQVRVSIPSRNPEILTPIGAPPPSFLSSFCPKWRCLAEP